MSARCTAESLSRSVAPTGSSGIGLLVLGQPYEASDDRTLRLQAAQFACGFGPSLDAFHRNEPTELVEFGSEQAAWSGAATFADAGIRGLLALPLRVDGGVIGSVTFYRRTRAPMTRVERAAADECALDTTHALVADWLGPPVLSTSGERDDRGRTRMLHCATGMVMVQLDLLAVDAVAVIRARAFAAGVTVFEVADDIVGHRLRLSQS